MIGKSNSLSLVFLNWKHYHASPEQSLLLWYKEEHLLMKETLLYSKNYFILLLYSKIYQEGLISV